MKLKRQLGILYRWGLRTFLYNDLMSALFFPRGYSKRINDTEIRLPFKYSWFYPGVYETGKTEFIKEHCKSGDTVIDIGAHLGVFSFFLAKQVGSTGKVYSFEPAVNTFKALEKTIRYNQLGNIVDTKQQAVSDTSGEIVFYIYNNSRISNANSISSHNSSSHAYKTTVTKISLDELYRNEGMNNLTLIKIDAEGAELDILRGGEELINKFHPFITLEVHPKSFDDPRKTMIELFDTITRYGYQVFMENHELSLPEFCKQDNYFEVLLIPK